MEKLRPVVVGATGAAGQNLVSFLERHPWFDIPDLAASERSAGKRYQDAIAGRIFFEKLPLEEILLSKVLNMKSLDPGAYDLMFSALPAEVARELEPKFAEHIPVISTASSFRYETDVPILVPGINSEHAKIISRQRKRRGWKGFIVPIPNCTATGLVITLKPLQESFGITHVHMASMQALSGAGEKGIVKESEYRKSATMNVLPYIEKEEDKVIRETKKILGKYKNKNGKIEDARIKIGCSCNRVFVEDVHTEAVWVRIKKHCTPEKAKRVMESYKGDHKLSLPSAPKKLIVVVEDENLPQPVLHREKYGRMVTVVGRLRRDEVFPGIAYTLTTDNTGMGAGGGAVLVAEYLKAIEII